MPSVCSEIEKYDIFLYIRHMLWLCHLRGRKKQSSQDQWFEPSDVTHSKWPIYHGCPSVNNECLILVTFNNTQLDSNTYVWNDGKWWWNDGNIISLTQTKSSFTLQFKRLGSLRFLNVSERGLLWSPRLHLFIQKYSKNRNIVK